MSRWLRPRRLAPVLVLGWLLVVAPVPVAASSMSLASGLAQARSALAAGHRTLAVVDLRGLQPRLPAVATVISSIQHGDLRLAAAQLGSLEAAVASPPRAPTAAAVASAARSVFASPQMTALGHNPASASLVSDLAGFLQGLLRRVFHLVGASDWVVLAVVILVLGAALALAFIQRSRGRLPPAGADPHLNTPAGADPRPERLFAAAESFQRQGALKEAVRMAFQGLLLSASYRRVLAVDPAWTNSDLLRAAGQVAGLEPRLRPLVSQFNAVVYGGRDPGVDGCAQFTQACRSTAGELFR
ncbi:MAG: DUF4129 domain-containing protein [Candidatus Dormibacteria bacterium]